MMRYTAVIFPLFVFAALALERKQWLFQMVTYISVLLFALFAILYTHAYWF